jgi:hypothetical protein
LVAVSAVASLGELGVTRSFHPGQFCVHVDIAISDTERIDAEHLSQFFVLSFQANDLILPL